jgi:hypothetical protein
MNRLKRGYAVRSIDAIAHPDQLPLRHKLTRPNATGPIEPDGHHRPPSPGRSRSQPGTSFLIYPWRVLCLPWLHPQVSCVYPGAVRTLILRTSTYADGEDHAAINELFDKMARTSPSQAAVTILRGVHAGKRRILVGPDAVAADLLARLAGTGYQQLFQLAQYLNQRQKDRTPATKEC